MASATVKNLFGKEVPRPVPQPRGGFKGVGCANCPLDKAPGIIKIKGLERIKRRKAMLWAQSPGRRENEKGLELVGPSGVLVWDTAAPFGLTRNSFDLQNAVRCRPTNDQGKDRPPSKDELRCCSIYNEEALELNRQAAVVHLVLGEVAGKQLLKKYYRKSEPIFWHPEWNAYVVVADHPSFVLRCGGKTSDVYPAFCERFRAVRSVLDHPGRWGYVLAQNYGAVRTLAEFEWLENTLYAEADAGRRISLDLEDGVVDGKKVPLMLGAGWGQYTKPGDPASWKGGARSVLLEHPQANNKKHLPVIRERFAKLLADPKVKKCFQHGSFDVPPIDRYFNVKLKGYDWDSQYGSFLYDSSLRSYSLDSIIKRDYLEFADYKKKMVAEWAGNFANASLERLVPYNLADCDVTKRVEARLSKKVSWALMQVYILDAMVLDEMEEHGPLLDWPEQERLLREIPKLIEPIENQLKVMSGNPDFNPGAPPQVAKFLFDDLKLPQLEGRSTDAKWMELLYQQTKHPAPKLIEQWRGLSVVVNTFLEGYGRSAKAHGDELRTVWWLCGAITGRLRSGKGDSEKDGIVNLQNVHGNPIIQNLIVSDRNWRLALGEQSAKDR